jgi:hypothetical protein
MTRSARARYAEALDVLLRGRVAKVVKERDWELLEEVAQLAQSDAPSDLAVTDPALFQAWRDAVTRFHKAGWTNMTPERVASVRRDMEDRSKAPASASDG